MCAQVSLNWCLQAGAAPTFGSWMAFTMPYCAALLLATCLYITVYRLHIPAYAMPYCAALTMPYCAALLLSTCFHIVLYYSKHYT